ncbi:cAMP phosphodiesterase [Planoprotostelium fungivorum]|uniref:Phosphodiesterase n=1 Tax=Planoprotostelium fungivorum TaxID=1890364 RepID=A0A2P6NQH2_9EUKA|nr:cAMP phosphodiesterase [Planoprotostelium fungivorum]
MQRHYEVRTNRKSSIPPAYDVRGGGMSFSNLEIKWQHIRELTKILVVGTATFTSAPATVAKTLSTLGYHVVLVEDVLQAISRIKEEKFGVVLVTIAQPGKEQGNSVLERMKQIDPELNVVMLSLRDSSETTLLYLRSGAADVLSAPLAPEVAQTRLGSIVEINYLKSELRTVSNENQIVNSALGELKSEQMEVTAARDQAVRQNDLLRTECQRQNALIREYETTIRKKNEESESIDSSVIFLNKEVDRWKAEATTLAETNRELQREHTLQKEQLENLKKPALLSGNEAAFELAKQVEINNALVAENRKLKENGGKIVQNQALLDEFEGLKKTLVKRDKKIASLRTIEVKLEEKEETIKSITKDWGDEKRERMAREAELIEMDRSLTIATRRITAYESHINELKGKITTLCWRLALLSSELTQRYVLNAPEFWSASEEGAEMVQKVKSSMSSPAENITQALNAANNPDMNPTQLRKLLQQVLDSIRSSNNIYRPSVTQMFEASPLDDMTQRWMEWELTSPLENQNPDGDNDVVDLNLDATVTSTWNFDVFNYEEPTLVALTVGMFRELGLLKKFSITGNTMTRFVEDVRASYRTNPYHNFRHAFDVTQTCFMMLKEGGAMNYLNPLDHFGLLMAALCHDLDHPGLNNNFHCAARSKLAMIYNDMSVLENHHCCVAFKLINKSKINVLSGLSASQYQEIRKTMVSAILTTDMSQHFELLGKFNTRLGTAEFSKENANDRQMIVQVLLHASDVSNVAKPVNVRRWSDLCFEEFLCQGDKEKEMGLPVSPFFDRKNTDQVKLSLNFIDYLTHPLYSSLTKVLPKLEVCLNWMKQSREYWSKQSESEVVLPQVDKKEAAKFVQKTKRAALEKTAAEHRTETTRSVAADRLQPKRTEISVLKEYLNKRTTTREKSCRSGPQLIYLDRKLFVR